MKHDIICIGTALVDSIIRGFDPTPVSATGFTAESASLNVGGEAVNVGMAAAKLGLRTGILCFLGTDSAGDLILQTLMDSGVDTAAIVRTPEHPTPVTTMFVNGDGTRKSITNGSHRYNFHPEEHIGAFTDAKALVLGSLFRAPFDDPGIIHAVLAAAADAGQTVFADTKLPNFKVLGLADIRDSLPLIDYITPNEDEAKYLTGKDDPGEMAGVFLDMGVKNVLIKLGARGCFFKNAHESIRLPAFEIEAVDATGAGDNMLAGMAGELLRGAGTLEALRFGNACGAICTTAVGAGTALKSRNQVLSFIRNKKGIDNQKQ